MNQDKELLNLEKRFAELSRTAYQRDIITYTDFLNLNEQNILHMLPKDRLYTRVVYFGGYEMAERQMAAFIPDALYLRYGKNEITPSGALHSTSAPELYLRYGKNEITPAETGYPFCALKITPVNLKFAEKLTHRDYLGAVLNLGIDRSRTGDIIPEDTGALLFVHNDIADFLCSELTRVRHTSVSAEQVPLTEIDYTPEFEEVRGTVASVRLDSLLSLAFNQSRSRLTGLIEGAKVYVNGRLITSNGYQPEEGDIISVRGMGKFRYEYVGGRTRKNRISVVINRYI